MSLMVYAAAVFSATVNPMNDETSYHVRYGDRTTNMTATCWPTRRNLQITFSLGESLWEGSTRTSGYYEPLVPVRVNNDETRQMRFLVERRRAHLIDREYVDSIVSSLADGGRVVIEFTSYEKTPIYFFLDHESIREPMQKLRSECPSIIK